MGKEEKRTHNMGSCCTTCPVNTGTTPKNRKQNFLAKKYDFHRGVLRHQ
jgi:hypothetical protein